MTSNLVIFNEKELAEKVYKVGFENGFTWQEGLLLAKYFCCILGYGESRSKSFLIDFIESHDSFFNYIRNRKVVGKMIKKAHRDGLLDTGFVSICKRELDAIREIKNFKYQKIILATLFLSKRNTNRGYINLKDWVTIKKMVSRKITNSDIQRVFSLLYEIGYIEPVGASQRILFSDGGQLERVFYVDDNKKALSLIHLYVEYCGGELGYCRKCATEFVKVNGRQVLCVECSKNSRLEKYRKYNKKRANHL